VRLLKRLAFHPAEVRPFKEFVADLGIARKMLTTFLEQVNSELPRGW